MSTRVCVHVVGCPHQTRPSLLNACWCNAGGGSSQERGWLHTQQNTPFYFHTGRHRFIRQRFFPSGDIKSRPGGCLLTKATLIAILGCTTGTARLTKFAQWEIQTYTHTRTRRWQLHTGRTNTCRGTAKGLLRASWLCCAAPLLSMENSNKLCFSKNTQPQN